MHAQLPFPRPQPRPHIICAGIVLACLALTLGGGCPRFQTGPVRYAAPAKEFTTVKGRRLHFVDKGDPRRETIVFIHGFASALVVWKRLMRDLSGRYRVIALDLPGFGLSDKRKGDYSPSVLADVVAGLLAQRGIARAHVVAHSWGSSIALALAHRHPRRVASLALLSAFVYDKQLLPFQRWSKIRGLGELLFALFYKERLGDRLALAFHRPEAHATYREEQQVERAVRRPGAVRAALQATRQMHFDRLEKHYPTVRARTLLLWGRDDAIAAPKYGERLLRELRDARLRVLPQCGHFPMLEAYPATLSILRDHFAAPTRAR